MFNETKEKIILMGIIFFKYKILYAAFGLIGNELQGRAQHTGLGTLSLLDGHGASGSLVDL